MAELKRTDLRHKMLKKIEDGDIRWVSYFASTPGRYEGKSFRLSAGERRTLTWVESNYLVTRSGSLARHSQLASLTSAGKEVLTKWESVYAPEWTA